MRLPVLAVMLIAFASCKDECNPAVDLPYCEGRTRVTCVAPGVDQLVNAVNRWSHVDCPALCVVDSRQKRALCALSADPEPLCSDGATRVCPSRTQEYLCESGFLTARYPCLDCTANGCKGGPASPCTLPSDCAPGYSCQSGYCYSAGDR